VTDAADARGWASCRDRRWLRRRRFGAITIGLAALILTRSAQAAALALVLAIDVSESVSSERYLLQHEGIARAFEAPLLVDAIAAVPGVDCLLIGTNDLAMELGIPGGFVVATFVWRLVANSLGISTTTASPTLALLVTVIGALDVVRGSKPHSLEPRRAWCVF